MLHYLWKQGRERHTRHSPLPTPPPSPPPHLPPYPLSECVQRQLGRQHYPPNNKLLTGVICWKAGLPRSQFLFKSLVRTSFGGGGWGGIWKFPCETGLTSLAFPRVASSQASGANENLSAEVEIALSICGLRMSSLLYSLHMALFLLQEGGPLPGPETGLLSNTWK